MATKKEKDSKVKAKNAPIYSFEVGVKEEGKRAKTKFAVRLKKATRSMMTDADMYYTIQLNKYIKMGLLTAEQAAKMQVDAGGMFTEDQQRHYIKVQALLAEKQEILTKLIAKNDPSPDEEDRKRRLYEDVAILRSQIADYEYIRNQSYDHTANAKARNDVVLWWVLHLTEFGEIKDDEDTEMKPMFPGESLDAKKMALESAEDDEDPLVSEVFFRLVKAVTIWYWMGQTEPERIKELVEQEEKQASGEISSEDDG